MNVVAPNSIQAPAFGIGRAWALLAGALTAATVGLGIYAFSAKGQAGLLAVIAAAFVCLIADSIALAIKNVFRHPNQAVQGVLGAMLVRMGIPAMAAIVSYSQQPNWVRAGFVDNMVLLYLVGLAVETAVSVRMLNAARSVQDVSVQRAS